MVLHSPHTKTHSLTNELFNLITSKPCHYCGKVSQPDAEPPHVSRKMASLTGAQGGKNAKSYWTDRLTRFYQKYNPDKVSSVAATLKKYKGHEMKLFTVRLNPTANALPVNVPAVAAVEKSYAANASPANVPAVAALPACTTATPAISVRLVGSIVNVHSFDRAVLRDGKRVPTEDVSSVRFV